MFALKRDAEYFDKMLHKDLNYSLHTGSTSEFSFVTVITISF